MVIQSRPNVAFLLPKCSQKEPAELITNHSTTKLMGYLLREQIPPRSPHPVYPCSHLNISTHNKYNRFIIFAIFMNHLTAFKQLIPHAFIPAFPPLLNLKLSPSGQARSPFLSFFDFHLTQYPTSTFSPRHTLFIYPFSPLWESNNQEAFPVQIFALNEHIQIGLIPSRAQR